VSTDKKDLPTSSSPSGTPLSEGTRRELIAALQQNWQREVEGVRTYSDLARGERDPARRKVLERLAEAEQKHAQRWERKLAELGAGLPKEQRTLGTRFQGWLRRQLGTEATLRQLEQEEDKYWRVHSNYSLLLSIGHSCHHCCRHYQPDGTFCRRSSEDAGDRSLLVQ
jgi:hypothetical protein